MNHHAKSEVAGPKLRRQHHLTPITGLCFLTSASAQGADCEKHEIYVLAGEDTDLKVYDGEGRPRCQLRVFRAQPIHGIRVGNDEHGRRHVLVWGNQAVAVIPVNIIEERLAAIDDGGNQGALLPWQPEVVEAVAPDWIYDGAISPDEPGCGVLVTAHNEVIEFSFSEDGKKLEFGRIVSPSRPILYSANLTWISKTSVLVAGGTVFGEIIVWKCHFSGGAEKENEEPPPRCEVLFVFTGHEGSIFGVDISPEIDLGGRQKARLLASCSDDRTIRIWDITEKPEASRLQYDSLGEARETGFGGAAAAATAAAAAATCASIVTAPTDLTVAQAASSAPLAMVMGHISRIWHVRFPRTLDELAQGSAATFYSFGEDSTLQTWSLEVDIERWRQQKKSLATNGSGCGDRVSSVSAKILHKETYTRHDGKHIWATALMQRADGEVLVATGGADSKINLLSDRSRASRSRMADLPSELHMLVMQDVIDKLPARNPDSAIPSEAREAFHRFAFISQDTLLATSTTGRLLVGSFGPELTWSEIGTDGKTLGALRACTTLKSPGRGLALLGTAGKKILLYRDSAIQEIGSVPGKVADIFCLNVSSSTPAAGAGASDGQFELEFLVTTLGGQEAMQILTLNLSTCMVKSMIPVPDLDARFVVTAASLVGDVIILGSRHGYMSVFRRFGNQLISILPAPDRRTTDAITSIAPFPASSVNTLHILTTSRDGNYRIYELDPSSAALHLRHETAPAAVPNLEDAWLAGSDLILCGFRSKNFVVWNETRHEELVRVDCGGAHRVFAYSPRQELDRIRFVFNKSATLGIYERPNPRTAIIQHRTLKHGTHGREVRAVSYSGARYVATGAEDTAIRIWEYAPHARVPMSCVKIVKVHTTGLQSLKWLSEELLFSCSGNEEFMVWRVRDLGPAGGLGLMREAVLADKSADGDLRITSFDVADVGTNMREVAITMVFSNSVVKTYRYTSDNGFRLLAAGQYTGACLTQVRHLRTSAEGVSDVITAATDGHLTIWRSSGAEYVLRHTARIHQSSIKALDVCAGPNGVVVLTGGDDNAVGITTLNADFTPVARAGVRKAHAAAINGLAVLEGTREGSGWVFATASNDQRVKVWQLGWREGGVEEITLLADRYSGVADAGDLEVVGNGKFVVGGVGLEIWDWDSAQGFRA